MKSRSMACLILPVGFGVSLGVVAAFANPAWKSVTLGPGQDFAQVEWAQDGAQVKLTGAGGGDAGQFVYQLVQGNFELAGWASWFGRGWNRTPGSSWFT